MLVIMIVMMMILMMIMIMMMMMKMRCWSLFLWVKRIEIQCFGEGNNVYKRELH